MNDFLIPIFDLKNESSFITRDMFLDIEVYLDSYTNLA